jgi:competence protein ComK
MKVITKELIEEYEINPFTLAILPLEYGSKTYSQILELDKEIHSPFKPLDIIKTSCSFFGCSYEGRKVGSKKLIGYTHKVPITIDSTNYMYFFPTSSPSKAHCAWISHEHVLDYKRTELDTTLVTFRNKQSIEIDISTHTFENQMLRTALLRTKLVQNIEEHDRKSLLNYRGYSRASEKPTPYFEIEINPDSKLKPKPKRKIKIKFKSKTKPDSEPK